MWGGMTKTNDYAEPTKVEHNFFIFFKFTSDAYQEMCLYKHNNGTNPLLKQEYTHTTIYSRYSQTKTIHKHKIQRVRFFGPHKQLIVVTFKVE